MEVVSEVFLKEFLEVFPEEFLAVVLWSIPPITSTLTLDWGTNLLMSS